MNILAELQQRFLPALAGVSTTPEVFAAMVRPAQDAKFGDYQANFAMPLAKQVGVPPRELAARLVAEADLADLCLPPEVAGPGFINLTLRPDALERLIRESDRDSRLGVPAAAQPHTIIIDFSSPNVAKPMHVGHLRSTVIGDAIYRILTFAGHHAVSDNHIGDWGTQFGMILYGYKHFLDQSAYDADRVAELARLYRLVNRLSEYHEAKGSLTAWKERLQALSTKLAENEQTAGKDKSAASLLKKLRNERQAAADELQSAESKVSAVESDSSLLALAQQHPSIARASRDETAKLHAGDPENRRLWNEFLPACLNALQRVYQRLNVRFDKTLGESFYDPFLSEVVADLRTKGLAVESDGAQCVFIEGRRAPFIIQKADGAFTYATTDLATIQYRVRELGAQEIVYVVDARQSEHFTLLFETARRWGFHDLALRHVSFGMVLGDDNRPFKTRAGDTVGLESLLDEAVNQARKIVNENDDARRDSQDRPAAELDDAARGAVAEAVGLGGIKYADLHHNRESDYIFSWSKMLEKTGDTATYMQYAFARTQGILRKAAAAEGTPDPGVIRLGEPAERMLALHLCRFPEAIAAVVQEYRPNLLTQYLFELANSFSTFYDACPVMKEPDREVQASRLELVDLTGRVIRQGLSLLGIEACEQM